MRAPRVHARAARVRRARARHVTDRSTEDSDTVCRPQLQSTSRELQEKQQSMGHDGAASSKAQPSRRRGNGTMRAFPVALFVFLLCGQVHSFQVWSKVDPEENECLQPKHTECRRGDIAGCVQPRRCSRHPCSSGSTFDQTSKPCPGPQVQVLLCRQRGVVLQPAAPEPATTALHGEAARTASCFEFAAARKTAPSAALCMLTPRPARYSQS